MSLWGGLRAGMVWSPPGICAITTSINMSASTSIAARGDSIVVTGTLTFHGITKDIVAPAKPQWGNHRLSVQGTFAVSLTEFGIDRPSLLMIPVEDRLSFVFTAVFAWN
jgi:polyisoprenoid-binding protein YceI